MKAESHYNYGHAPRPVQIHHMKHYVKLSKGWYIHKNGRAEKAFEISHIPECCGWYAHLKDISKDDIDYPY